MHEVIKNLQKLKNPEKAKVSSSFFKTGKGEYGEGDIFWGITTPEIRKFCKGIEIDLSDISKMLDHKVHEVRFTALVLLRNLYEKSDDSKQKKIFKFYIKNAKKINNWDLVDISAPYILGDYLLKNKKERKILYKLVKSKNVWERRISVLANFPVIKKGDFNDLEKISILLLKDDHDLIQKAVGWMLRESGKVNINFLLKFLDNNFNKMPRVMLRYAIERLGEKQRMFYLKNLI